jgi:hypothetical protein
MTYLEALKAKLNYPLTDNAFTLALTDRGITAKADYSNQQFQLALPIHNDTFNIS